MKETQRTALAIIGGFIKPLDHKPHGTVNASFLLCQALAASPRYPGLDVYLEEPKHLGSDVAIALPKRTGLRVFEKPDLSHATTPYAVIYAANGEQIVTVPWTLRPRGDWAPVVCTVGTAHVTGQWSNLLAGLLSGAIRASDGFVFKSQAARRIFHSVWTGWAERFGNMASFPRNTAVIANGVDIAANQRREAARKETRARLKLGDENLVFLSFNRLSPGTKGDHLALIVRWQDVVARIPHAVLILAGATVDKDFTGELRSTARAAGVGSHVIILDNPYATFSDARTRLMSAADVFVHLTTGVEETSPLVVHEALAHSLPVLATRWAGLSEIIEEGSNGHLVATRSAPLDPCLSDGHFGVLEIAHALRASRAVSCAWDQLLPLVERMADNQVRAQMALAARKSAEARAPDKVAHATIAFFDAVSGDAQAAWNNGAEADSSARFRPLVDVEIVLREQGAQALTSSRLVRLADRTRARWLTAEGGAEPPANLTRVLGQWHAGEKVSLAELSRLLTPGPPCPALSEEDARFRAAGPLLMRLLSYGVLEFAD